MHSNGGNRDVSCDRPLFAARPRTVRLSSPQPSGGKGAAPAVRVDNRAHQVLCLPERTAIRKLLPSKGNQGRSAHAYSPSRVTRPAFRPGVHRIPVPALRFDRGAGTSLALELQRVSHCLEETLLEDAKVGFRIAHAPDSAQNHSIVLEQYRFRIVSVKKAKQKLVDVKPDDCGGAYERHDCAFGLRAGQSPKLTSATPRQQQWNERLQQATHFGLGTSGAAGNQTEAAMATTEYLHEKARFPIGPGVEHE